MPAQTTRGCFVTGTDTGVGKTVVAMSLLRAATRRGLTAGAMKPVESGCQRVSGLLVAHDANLLASCASAEMVRDFDTVCPFRFEMPAAPSVAARHERVAIDFAVIERAHGHLLARKPGMLVVEGAGGFLAPVDDAERTMADLASQFAYPVLIVAPDRLGSINHTLLTIEAVRRRGLVVAGVVLNAGPVPARDLYNAEEIHRVSKAPVLGTFPWLGHADEMVRLDLGQIAERALDLSDLFGGAAG